MIADRDVELVQVGVGHVVHAVSRGDQPLPVDYAGPAVGTAASCLDQTGDPRILVLAGGLAVDDAVGAVV